MSDLYPSNSIGYKRYDLSGGELIIAILRVHSAVCSKSMDLTRLNMLAFLAEGECGINSDILFIKTKFGPKSEFIRQFVKENKEIIHSRKTGGSIARFPDEDLRLKVHLTDTGMQHASRIINFLTVGKLRALSHILSKWGDESPADLLTYICVFFDGFCPEVLIDPGSSDVKKIH